MPCHSKFVNSDSVSLSFSSPSFYHAQRGASVSGIVFFILALGVFVKLGLAIVPAQISDYQTTKLVADKLADANAKKLSSSQFMKELKKQLSINADYSSKPEEMFTFSNKQRGKLVIHKKYEVINNFAGNVDILNRFDGEIKASQPDE